MRIAYALATVAALAAHAERARAQVHVVPPSAESARHGCTGFGYAVKLSPVTQTVNAMTITSIDSLSPSFVAGVRSDDQVLAINGSSVLDGRIGRHWSAPPGTSYTMRIRRDTAEREVAFASGRRVPADAATRTPTRCAPATIHVRKEQ